MAWVKQIAKSQTIQIIGRNRELARALKLSHVVIYYTIIYVEYIFYFWKTCYGKSLNKPKSLLIQQN